MPIEFKCVACGAAQKAADHLVGRVLKCYQCGAVFTVPALAVPPPALPAPGAAFEISTSTIDLAKGDDAVQFT